MALQIDSEVKKGKVVRRATGPDGKVTGTHEDNPILNTVLYDVEFPDGQVREYAANVIAENMLTQVDSDRFTLTIDTILPVISLFSLRSNNLTT